MREQRKNGKNSFLRVLFFDFFDGLGYVLWMSIVLGLMAFGGGLFLFNLSFITTGAIVVGIFVVGGLLYMFSQSE